MNTIRDSDEDDENDTSNLVESQHKIQLYYVHSIVLIVILFRLLEFEYQLCDPQLQGHSVP